jgi:epoxyqueuosine reductase QueG
LRALLKKSAIRRAGVTRLRRNLATALGNSGDTAAVAALEGHPQPACSDPLVAQHVVWAVAKLRKTEPQPAGIEPV